MDTEHPHFLDFQNQAEVANDAELPSPFSLLPNEIILTMTDEMKVRDIAALASVNRYFHDLLNPVLYSNDARFGHSSALEFAASNGCMNTARLSISRGGNPNAQEDNILISAINNRDVDMVQLLLEHGADPDRGSPASDNIPPLLWPFRCRKAEHIPDDHLRYSRYPTLCLRLMEGYHAKVWESVPIISMMLEYSSNVNFTDRNGCTGLHFAAELGLHELAERFLRKGANIEARDLHGHTPIIKAVLRKCPKTVEVLLKHKANTEIRWGWDMNTPLLLTIRSQTSRASNRVAKLLLQYGADPEASDKNDDTPLHETAKNGDAKTARRLIEMGVDLDRRNARQETPLQVAVTAQHISVVKMLLRHDANPYSREIFRKTKPANYGEGAALNLLAAKGVDGRKLAHCFVK